MGLLKIIFILFQINNSYIIDKIYDDKIFYNFVIYDQTLYVSSNNGIYKFDYPNNNQLILFDKEVKGPINTDFSKNNNYAVKFINKDFNISPKVVLDGITDYAYFGNNLFIIRRGVLTSFKTLSYIYKPYESVRSITENTIGTYNGIFVNNSKLKKLKYTDGQIREFSNVTFVCYNGLLSIEDNIETIIYRNINSKRTRNQYGKINDIYLIDYPNFLAISDNGLYNFNYENYKFDLIYSSVSKKKPIIPLKEKTDNNLVNNVFTFIENDKYVKIDLKSLDISKVNLDLNYKITDIIECDLNVGVLYAISQNNNLLKLKRNSSLNSLELIEKIPINLTAHTISNYKDLIFLSGNNGLSIYDKNKMKMFEGYIIDEFNRNAVYKSNNQITFGSLNGIYEFSDLNFLIKNLVFPDFEIKKTYNYPAIIMTNLLLVIFLISLINYNRSKKNKNISNEKMVIKIKGFINKNLNNVTLKMLEDEFGLVYHEINSLDVKFRPGAYIKVMREITAQKMFWNKKTISEISKKTGYSESYLIKNKTRFINKKFIKNNSRFIWVDIFNLLDNFFLKNNIYLDKYLYVNMLLYFEKKNFYFYDIIVPV